MKTPLETRGSHANDGRSARLGKKQPDGTHAQRIAHVPRIRPGARYRRARPRSGGPELAVRAQRRPGRGIRGKRRYRGGKFIHARISACLAIPLDRQPDSTYSY